MSQIEQIEELRRIAEQLAQALKHCVPNSAIAGAGLGNITRRKWEALDAWKKHKTARP